MSLFSTLAVTAAGMNVQRQRIDVTAQNLANATSTRTPEGGPYQRKEVIIGAQPLSFDEGLKTFMQGAGRPTSVQVMDVKESSDPPKQIYDPHHPDADPNGFVSMPDINTTQELVDIMTASKAYEANVTAFNAAKSMALRTFEIGAA